MGFACGLHEWACGMFSSPVGKLPVESKEKYRIHIKTDSRISKPMVSGSRYILSDCETVMSPECTCSASRIGGESMIHEALLFPPPGGVAWWNSMGAWPRMMDRACGIHQKRAKLPATRCCKMKGRLGRGKMESVKVET